MHNRYSAMTAKFCSITLMLVCFGIVCLAQSPQSERRDVWLLKNVHFTNSSQKAVINTLAGQLGAKVIFDDAVKDAKLSMELHDLTLEAALKIVLIQQGLQARIADDGSIIVFLEKDGDQEKFKQYKPWPAKKS